VDSAPTSEFRVGFIGRLERRKGVDVLLNAISEEDSLDLTVVGHGPEEQNLKATAALRGKNVTFLGFATPEELPDIYRSFAVVAVPSVPTPSWNEQFCRVAVEAMASGVPVVASSSGALPEVVDGGGLLVDPGDPAQLRNALLRLEKDPHLRADLAKRARERAAIFEWRHVAQMQRDFYEAVLS
jgi:glycosyltransferase involved in cell wall biosynthesis